MGDGCGGGSLARRAFLLTGVGAFLTACSASPRTATNLPGPVWDVEPPPFPAADAPPAPSPTAPATSAASTRIPGVLARDAWAQGAPAPGLMKRLRSVRYITVHHDGMAPFSDPSREGAASRLESIRRAHRGSNWGDIGYHFAIDRGGRVWEGRALAYQGAHVKDHNEGNVGVVLLGNFDEQRPSAAQIEALREHVNRLMRVFHVSADRLRTHQEWAPTACPGRSLQRHMVEARRGNAFG
jgi:hypothetical protein